MRIIFLDVIKKIVDYEREMENAIGDKEKLAKAKKMGFSDKYIAHLWKMTEDEIYAMQSDYDGIKKSDPDNDYDTHECCVRVVDSKYQGGYFGYPLGQIKAGETAYKTFVLDLKPSWKIENMHLALFVSHDEGKSKYTVCNAVDVPLTEPTPFEYKK